MVLASDIFGPVADSLFDLFEDVPQNSTFIQIVDDEPSNDIALTTPTRSIYLNLSKERMKLMDDPTRDFRDVKFIQSELKDTGGNLFTPKLQHRVKDASNKTWIVKRVEEDPAHITWTLLVVAE